MSYVFVALCAAAALLSVAAIWRISYGGKREATLDVTFKLTDLEYNPLAGVPVRLVFCCDQNWQSADAGNRFVTDEKGEGRVTAHVIIERHLRKLPANFMDSLFSLPQPTDHLAAGAEMEYMDFHWLYVVNMERFRDGTVMQDAFAVYSRDGHGHFTMKAVETREGWKIKDLGGLMLTGPGHTPWNAMLERTATEGWTLQFAFKKSPPAARR